MYIKIKNGEILNFELYDNVNDVHRPTYFFDVEEFSIHSKIFSWPMYMFGTSWYDLLMIATKKPT